MSNKLEILKTLRDSTLPDVPLPPPVAEPTTYQDPIAHFCQVLEAVGGRAIRVGETAEIQAGLEQLPPFAAATRVWSLVPEVPSLGGDWHGMDDPHQFETLDFCVVPGHFLVAENGAVWITDESIPHRAALFVAQHLAIVVPVTEIVHNMHDAYARVSFDDARFGAFISGPSKTADIEQSLVIGAHGARSATVILVG